MELLLSEQWHALGQLLVFLMGIDVIPFQVAFLASSDQSWKLLYKSYMLSTDTILSRIFCLHKESLYGIIGHLCSILPPTFSLVFLICSHLIRCFGGINLGPINKNRYVSLFDYCLSLPLECKKGRHLVTCSSSHPQCLESYLVQCTYQSTFDTQIKTRNLEVIFNVFSLFYPFAPTISTQPTSPV